MTYGICDSTADQMGGKATSTRLCLVLAFAVDSDFLMLSKSDSAFCHEVGFADVIWRLISQEEVGAVGRFVCAPDRTLGAGLYPAYPFLCQAVRFPATRSGGTRGLACRTHRDMLCPRSASEAADGSPSSWVPRRPRRESPQWLPASAMQLRQHRTPGYRRHHGSTRPRATVHAGRRRQGRRDSRGPSAR